MHQNLSIATPRFEKVSQREWLEVSEVSIRWKSCSLSDDNIPMSWPFVELFANYLPEIGLTCVYALAIITCIGLCSEKLRRKLRKEENQKLDSTERVVRRLGPLESVCDDLHGYGGDVQTIVLLLKSKVSLSSRKVRQVLDALPKRHPLLRMRIEEFEVGRDGSEKSLKYFVEEEDPCDVNFYVRNKPSGNWESSLEKELLTAFQPGDEPLWRVRMLKEQLDTREGWYSNTLLFTTHLAIADGASLLKLCEDFTDSLNSTYSRETSGEYEEERCALPLRPPLSELLKHRITLSQFGQVICALKSILTGLMHRIRGKPSNQFTVVFPPSSLQDPSTPKKTCIVPRTLPQEAVLQLAKSCKENQCTVHGAFIAATTIAMATMLQNGELRIPLDIPLSCSINVRQECKPVVARDELGCFTLDCQFKVGVPVLEKSLDDFWTFAQDCTKRVQEAVARGQHHSTLKMLRTLNTDLARKLHKTSKNKSTAGRVDSLLNISNLGRCEFGKEASKRKTFDCTAVYFAKSGHNFGPVFGNNIATINGELFWGFVYYSNVVTHDVACNFSDLVLSIIKRVSGLKAI